MRRPVRIVVLIAVMALVAYGGVSWLFSDKLIARQFTPLGPVEFGEFSLPQPATVTIRGDGVDLASWYFANPLKPAALSLCSMGSAATSRR